MSSVYFCFNFNRLFDTAALNGKRLHSNDFIKGKHSKKRSGTPQKFYFPDDTKEIIEQLNKILPLEKVPNFILSEHI